MLEREITDPREYRITSGGGGGGFCPGCSTSDHAIWGIVVPFSGSMVGAGSVDGDLGIINYCLLVERVSSFVGLFITSRGVALKCFHDVYSLFVTI